MGDRCCSRLHRRLLHHRPCVESIPTLTPLCLSNVVWGSRPVPRRSYKVRSRSGLGHGSRWTQARCVGQLEVLTSAGNFDSRFGLNGCAARVYDAELGRPGRRAQRRSNKSGVAGSFLSVLALESVNRAAETYVGSRDGSGQRLPRWAGWLGMRKGPADAMWYRTEGQDGWPVFRSPTDGN